MLRDDLILRTRLVPPRLHRHTLARPALIAKLRETLDVRCTVVHAGTGYGKSTALAAFVGHDADLVAAWYSLSEADADPQRFLAYLIAAFRLRYPALSELPQAILQEAGPVTDGGQRWENVVDALINALTDCITTPAVLVLDDFHFVHQTPAISGLIERFIAHAPADLHVILATRHPLHTAALTAWRARGDLIEIGRGDLAFRPDEIDALFRDTYGVTLTPEDLAVLTDRTEGWPIALQLVWQGIRSRIGNATQLLVPETAAQPLTALFEFLANEVLDRQPARIVEFLLDVTVLRELTPAACDAATGRAGSADLINQLVDRDLFVIALGDQHYRFHHLFHDFLRSQLASREERSRACSERAAAYFQAQGDPDEAIYHWISAGQFDNVAATIEAEGEAFLRRGRLDTVATWIDAVPASIVAERPALQRLLGDRVTINMTERERHSHDESSYTSAPPDAVCFPCSTDEVAQIVKEIMEGSMQVVIRNVKVKAEPCLMERWMKEAEPVLDLEILEWAEFPYANLADPSNTDTHVEVLIRNPHHLVAELMGIVDLQSVARIIVPKY